MRVSFMLYVASILLHVTVEGVILSASEGERGWR